MSPASVIPAGRAQTGSTKASARVRFDVGELVQVQNVTEIADWESQGDEPDV